MIVPRHLAAVGICIDDFRILGIGRDESALAAPDLEPILAADDSVIVAARDRNRRVVLLRAVYAIGPAVIDGHMIELRRGLVVWRSPRLAAIHEMLAPPSLPLINRRGSFGSIHNAW